MRHNIDAPSCGSMDDLAMQPADTTSIRLTGGNVTGVVGRLLCGVDDGNFVYGTDSKELTPANLIQESGYLLAQIDTFQMTLREYDTWTDGDIDEETRIFQESYKQDMKVIQGQLSLIPNVVLQKIQGLFDQFLKTERGSTERRDILGEMELLGVRVKGVFAY